MKALVKHFQPGEGPCRGLLRDCEIFANLGIAFVSSSNDEGCWLQVGGPAGAGLAVWAEQERGGEAVQAEEQLRDCQQVRR